MLALMDAQGWSSAHVVGHSLRGLVALYLALLCTFAPGAVLPRLTPRMLARTGHLFARCVWGLSVPASGGVYAYGPSSTFPTETWNDSNCWVEPVFRVR
ncbi:hypothetical protein D7X74_29415 [Corallococcus sp. CA047B]|uniref:hypothetical protein n=1 Tax=Corallococcus sp. CA047B TaxID=2316729 RepID=UPI000EA0F17A|nr:hypothetical protein [Corallococcus sp. CA047B]RKH09517.1 hypothetical protein D7X74_29415 [Corallococcus sp. CA047B]